MDVSYVIFQWNRVASSGYYKWNFPIKFNSKVYTITTSETNAHEIGNNQHPSCNISNVSYSDIYATIDSEFTPGMIAIGI